MAAEQRRAIHIPLARAKATLASAMSIRLLYALGIGAATVDLWATYLSLNSAAINEYNPLAELLFVHSWEVAAAVRLGVAVGPMWLAARGSLPGTAIAWGRRLATGWIAILASLNVAVAGWTLSRVVIEAPYSHVHAPASFVAVVGLGTILAIAIAPS